MTDEYEKCLVFLEGPNKPPEWKTLPVRMNYYRVVLASPVQRLTEKTPDSDDTPPRIKLLRRVEYIAHGLRVTAYIGQGNNSADYINWVEKAAP